MQTAPEGSPLGAAKLVYVQLALTLAQKHFPVASQRKRTKLDR